MVPGLLYQNSVCFYSLIFIPPSSHGLKPQVAWHIATVMIKHGTWIHPVVLDVPVPMVIATLPGFISRSARHSTSFPPSPPPPSVFQVVSTRPHPAFGPGHVPVFLISSWNSDQKPISVGQIHISLHYALLSPLPSGKRLHKTMERSTMLLMGKSTISMAIFNSYLYVCLPEATFEKTWWVSWSLISPFKWLFWGIRHFQARPYSPRFCLSKQRFLKKR